MEKETVVLMAPRPEDDGERYKRFGGLINCQLTTQTAALSLSSRAALHIQM